MKSALSSRMQKHFSAFHAMKDFFHLLLSDSSKCLTAMLTLVGVYVFNVLAMGLSNASDLFESAFQELLKGSAEVVNIADDILVFRPTQEVPDNNVISFLERCLEVNFQ